MARQDGRIEPGQRLSTAISARAWNRAQQAADVVLGVQPGTASTIGTAEPPRVVVPCLVSSTIDNVKIGYVVKLTGASAYDVPGTGDNASKCVAAHCMTAEVVVPVSLENYAQAKTQLGVIVSGAAMPSTSETVVVNVCISGLCVARVRSRESVSRSSVGQYKFLQGPVLRSGDSATNLTGAAEACSCGSQRILDYVASADSYSKWAAVIL